jgi:uncharacterized protein (UPF0332 family)
MAREALAQRACLMAGDFAAAAGRAVYMAAYHAAQAFTLSRTGKAPKTHSGARSEFTRVSRTEPAIPRRPTAFLASAYELKAFADCDEAQPVSLASAQQALDEPAAFFEIIAGLV